MATPRPRPYAQFELTNENTNPIQTPGNPNGLFIDLPFLNGRYDWYALMTVPRSAYNIALATKVSRDHLPEHGAIQPRHVYNRMELIPLPDEGDNYILVKRELELDRHGVTTSIYLWLTHFVVECANNIGIRIHNRELRSWNELLEWITKYLKTKEDAMMLFKALFISFDYERGYKVHITCAIMYQHNFTLERSNDGNTRNFCEKLVTHRLNLLRKQAVDLSVKHSGWGHRIIRPPRKVGEPILPKHVAKFFHEWMLTYKPKKKLRSKRDESRRPNRPRNLVTYASKDGKRTVEDVLADISSLDDERIQLLAELEQFTENHNTEDINESATSLISLQSGIPKAIVSDIVVSENISSTVSNTVTLGMPSPNDSVTNESVTNTVTFDTSSPNSGIDETLEERRSPRIKRNRDSLPPPSLGQESEDEDTVVGIDSPDPNYKVDETDDEDDPLDVETRHDPILADIRKQLNGKRDSVDKVEESEDDSTITSDQKPKAQSNKKQRVDVNVLVEKTVASTVEKIQVAELIEKKKQAALTESMKKQVAELIAKKKQAALTESMTTQAASIGKKQSEITEVASIGKKQSEATDEVTEKQSKKDEATNEATIGVTPSTPKKTKVLHDTWVNSVVEQFLNSPGGKPPSRTSRNMKLSYNAKEVKTKMKEKKEATMKEKKEATKGKRTKKEVVTKPLNTITQCFRNKKNNKKNVKVNNVAKIDNNINIISDDEYEYEIFPYKGLPHKEMHNSNDKNPNPLPEKILNLRKVKGWKLEVLVQYVNTVREWSCIHGVIHDLKDETTAFMKTYGLTFSICGYGVDPSKFSQTKLNKIISTDDFEPPTEYNFKPSATMPREDVDYVELSKLIHRKLQKFATFLERPTDGQLEINVTPTTAVEYNDDDVEDEDDGNNAALYSSIMCDKTHPIVPSEATYKALVLDNIPPPDSQSVPL